MTPKWSDTQINAITKTNEATRDKLFRYAGKLPDSSRQKAMVAALDFFYSSKAKYPDLGKPAMIYFGYIIALKDFHFASHIAMKRKNSSDYADMADDLFGQKIVSTIKQKKSRMLKNKITPHLGEIFTARRNGVSFADIANFFILNYKIQISAEYIRRIFNENNR